MNRLIVARGLAGLVAVFLAYLGMRYTFTPNAMASFVMVDTGSTFGMANVRAMGAPLLMLAVLTGLGAAKQEFYF